MTTTEKLKRSTSTKRRLTRLVGKLIELTEWLQAKIRVMGK